MFGYGFIDTKYYHEQQLIFLQQNLDILHFFKETYYQQGKNNELGPW